MKAYHFCIMWVDETLQRIYLHGTFFLDEDITGSGWYLSALDTIKKESKEKDIDVPDDIVVLSLNNIT